MKKSVDVKNLKIYLSLSIGVVEDLLKTTTNQKCARDDRYKLNIEM